MFGVDTTGGHGNTNGSIRAGSHVVANGNGGSPATGAGIEDDGPPTNILQAAYVGALDTLKTMVARGQAADVPDPLRGSTPLHWASFGGHLDVVRWLVKEGGADVNRPNKDGCTPLLFACERRHTGVAQWLVREGGAQVNTKDDVTWQTPLHRVCLNSQRAKDASTADEDEDLLLWLVEAGADLMAVDRFGNHVEELRSPVGPELNATAPSRSAICEIISSSREEDGGAGTKEKLKRRGAVRRKSTGDITVQLSPKLEAKQRAPLSRRGNRKGKPFSAATAATGSAAGGADGASPSQNQAIANGAMEATPRILTGFGSLHHQRKTGAGRVVSKASSKDVFMGSPTLAARGTGGTGGGSAAPVAEAAAKMGGGPPAPVGEGREDTASPGTGDGGAGFMDEMVAMFGGSKAPGANNSNFYSNSSSRRHVTESELSQRPPRPLTPGGFRTLGSGQGGGNEASSRAGQRERILTAPQDVRRKIDTSGQHVVERIRELTLQKAAGEISDCDFISAKRQLLEMEQLRRDADEEARRRAEGQAVHDAGASILTSVSQNTPPPSPKSKENDGEDVSDDEEEDVQVSVMSPAAVKDRRETYKASDIDRYTKDAEAPRVFGEVPESLKESLAAKEAIREAALAAQAAKQEPPSPDRDEKKGKPESADVSQHKVVNGAKRDHGVNGSTPGGAPDDEGRTGDGAGIGGAVGAVGVGGKSGGSETKNKSKGSSSSVAVGGSRSGCVCVVM